MRAIPTICGLLCLLAFVAAAPARDRAAHDTRVEAVVLLRAPSLAQAAGPRSAASARIAAEQRGFAQALHASIPRATIRWRYRLVANGLTVVVPRSSLATLRSLDHVREVVASGRYRVGAATNAQAIAAAAAWTPGLENTGEGMKIAIIDDGVDQAHPYFDPTGYVMPAGYPKGQKAYTTAKVIVARAFPPPGAAWKHAARPFDPIQSEHGTHVAGIAAGNAGTRATGGRRVSGVAPRAFIGNYRALTVPTDSGVGLDGNAAELVAAIEAAVADGMDVINLSIGEPEVEPSRDIVARALDAAAELGVVPVVAAGNDYGEFGSGSVSSPGTSAAAITVAAADASTAGDPLASWSAAGPTALSLRLKPDVTAPGVGILSSVPDGWASISGTSMASPHVAGAAALLRERHPDWTVAQVKAALVATGDPVRVSTESQQLAPPTRAGGGMIDLQQADEPLLSASPASVSFGLVRPGSTPAATIDLADAGLGTGTWDVAVSTAFAAAGTTLTVPPAVAVPGPLTLSASIPVSAAEGDLSGWVTLTREGALRRIPFWLRVTRPRLESERSTPLLRPGTYSGNTRGKPARVSSYRYPEVMPDAGISVLLAGPEQLFRVRLRRPVANFGVAITGRSAGVRVEPRVVVAGDENRLTGYPALPLNLNPYLSQFGDPVLAAGAVRALAGSYDIVFDSPGRKGAGAFTFRYWVNDVRPPTLSLVARRVAAGASIRIRAVDVGSGVDPSTIAATIDGKPVSASFGSGTVAIGTKGLGVGRHALRLQVSDFQESRNMENVPPILPNTSVLRTVVVVVAAGHGKP